MVSLCSPQPRQVCGPPQPQQGDNWGRALTAKSTGSFPLEHPMGSTSPVKKLNVEIFIKAALDRKYLKAIPAGGLTTFLLPACIPAGSTWGQRKGVAPRDWPPWKTPEVVGASGARASPAFLCKATARQGRFPAAPPQACRQLDQPPSASAGAPRLPSACHQH